MIDVFLRWYPQSQLRRYMAKTVLERLYLLERARKIRLTVVSAEYIAEPFHINSKQFAETHAAGETYCVIDDDHLPVNRDFFEKGREALENHAEFGMVTARLLIEHQPFPLQPDVVEAHSIGAPYWVRKGTLSFPEGAKEQYDGVLSKVVTDQGLKTGIANKALCNHLGHGFSQVIEGHWNG